jgi:hypothetical protein
MSSFSRILRGGLIMGVVVVPLGALASHGKVGLWEVTTHVNMAGMMANIPPEALARMKAAGMNPSGIQTHTSQQCMTAEDVARDTPPTPRKNQGCDFTNLTHDAHNFTGDLICKSSEAQGRGHVAVTYDSDEHYSGNYAFDGTVQGHPQNITSTFEGRWISADCGGMK